MMKWLGSVNSANWCTSLRTSWCWKFTTLNWCVSAVLRQLDRPWSRVQDWCTGQCRQQPVVAGLQLPCRLLLVSSWYELIRVSCIVFKWELWSGQIAKDAAEPAFSVVCFSSFWSSLHLVVWVFALFFVVVKFSYDSIGQVIGWEVWVFCTSQEISQKVTCN